MVITLADWQFLVNAEETAIHTMKCAQDHCLCAYCRNYYDNVSKVHPHLKRVLERFGVDMNGPSELMPFEPTLLMACYRISGQITRWGHARLYVDGVPLRPEYADDSSFFLWIGELDLPWTQNEKEEDVISPANQPEFIDRMLQRWLETREQSESM